VIPARLVLALGLVAGIAYPWIASPYYATHMLRFFAYAVVVLGLNLLFGGTGLLSFGHSLFVAVGAYTAAVLTSQLGVRSMEAVLLASGLLSAAVAAPVGALCVRYVRIYFAMLTLAFAMLFHSFLLKFYHLTGGDEGMRVARPTLLGIDFSHAPQTAFLAGPYYYYAAAVLLALGVVMWRIDGSPFGLCLHAIRENSEKAASLGVAVTRYRWAAFVVSAVYGGIGGALLAPVSGQVDPGLAYWTHSGNLVFMTLLGGFAHFAGPVVGAFVFIHLQDQVMSLIPYWRLVFGIILAAVVIFAPGGLMSLLAARPAAPDARGPGTPAAA
jgi:branched-chain amino acid transport system permease protein